MITENNIIAHFTEDGSGMKMTTSTSTPLPSSFVGGTQCIIVSSFGTPTENGITLQAAYDDAKTRTPNGLPLSADNRITLVLTAGIYSGLYIDTEFIDIVSLTGNRDVITTNGIGVRANDVYLKGIDVLNAPFDLGWDTYPLLICENCRGGDTSFGGFANATGTFINCEAGTSSFGAYGTASGTFINCIGTNNSFGGYGIASGTFTNCIGRIGSFGGYGTASGTFTDCEAGDESFGSNTGTASGIFTNCTGGFNSFGGNITASGTFTNCTGGWFSFGGGGEGISSGTFTNCKGDDYSFGGANIASGTFIDCKSGNFSFGAYGTASGTFTNCVGGDYSFGKGSAGGISATARLYYCRLTSGTFPTVVSGGRTIYCIDGNNNTNNQ